MEEKIVRNSSVLNGTYDGGDLSVYSTVAQTRIVEGITVTKVPDKTLWANGPLTYTLVVSNTSEVDFELTSLVDVIDTTYVDFVPDSVRINYTPSSYTYISNTLTVELGTIPAGGSTTVSFQVLQN